MWVKLAEFTLLLFHSWTSLSRKNMHASILVTYVTVDAFVNSLRAMCKSPSVDFMTQDTEERAGNNKTPPVWTLIRNCSSTVACLHIFSSSNRLLDSSDWCSVKLRWDGWVMRPGLRQAIAFTSHLTNRSLSGHRAVWWVLPFHQ